MTVECTECSESHLVEPDAFDDGCMKYYAPFMADYAKGADDS